MKKRSEDSQEGVFLTIEGACTLTNLGRNTVRRLARECNAARKIGKSFRINRQILLDYIDTFEI